MSMKHHYIHHQLAGKTAVFNSAGKQESITGWKKTRLAVAQEWYVCYGDTIAVL